jgi:hypothetical protein
MMEDYSAIIVSIRVSTWIFLENIMLSEKADTKNHMSYDSITSKIGKFLRESRLVVVRG